MASVNKHIIVGNLGRDPEIRNTQDGKRIATLSIATSERWKDKSGEQQERTQWHRVVIFNDALAGVAEKYLRKGSMVYVEGQVQSRKYTDKEGNERTTTETAVQPFKGVLTILGNGKRNDDRDDDERPAQRNTSGGKKNEAAPDPFGAGDDFDDDIPF